MQRSIERILTTHTGSLPRPQPLQDVLFAREQEAPVEQDVFEKLVREAVSAGVQQQITCGLDIINDGEMSKISYGTYVKGRLTGFEATGAMPNFQGMSDLFEFPAYAQRMLAAMPLASAKYSSCAGPIAYTGTEQLQRDLANLKTASQGQQLTDVFMTAASPGVITFSWAISTIPAMKPISTRSPRR